MYGQLIFRKGVRQFNRERIVLQPMELAQLNTNMQKKKKTQTVGEYLFPTIYKN